MVIRCFLGMLHPILRMECGIITEKRHLMKKKSWPPSKKMKKNHPRKNIEIEARPAFMYKTMSFTVKSEGDEIFLEKL